MSTATRPGIRRPPSAGRVVLVSLVVSALLVGLEVGGGLALQRHRDRSHLVDDLRLTAALATFRPSERAGLGKRVTVADLSPDRSPRTDPARCTALTQLAVGASVGGGSWTGINGSPAQPVTTLTVRFADTATARRELRQKRLAVLSCRTVRLTFPPYEAPAQEYAVSGHPWPTALDDSVTYGLRGDGRTYGFYVRRYANTVTWSYADDVSEPAVRQQVVDSLVERLVELQRG